MSEYYPLTGERIIGRLWEVDELDAKYWLGKYSRYGILEGHDKTKDDIGAEEMFLIARVDERNGKIYLSHYDGEK